MFNLVDNKKTLHQQEEDTLAFWKQNQIFEKSVESRDIKNSYLFYDGPPFITGVPHYGTLLSSIAKDVIPRYQTMKGKRVRRVWGWDCHGLPMESKVESKLNVKGKKQIQEYGIDKFIDQCFVFAKEVSSEWDWYIDAMGRWVDFRNPYKTMDRDYMESVFWAFKEMYEKGYVYEGKRTSLFSTDASSPISNFEVAMDSTYEDVTEISCMASFKLKEAENRYMVAWTTTPWTLTANTALAVNKDEEYVEFNYKDGNYIIAAKRLEYVLEKGKIEASDINEVKKYKGEELQGWAYIPLYNFFEANENDYKVYMDEGVTTEDGTGVLHVAPGFGEQDFNLGKEHNLTVAMSIDDEGKILPFISPWGGEYLRDVSPKVCKDLREKNHLFAEFTYTHSLPFFRYTNPLIYKTQDAWYIDIKNNKDKLYDSNEEINWVPDHLKEGRFKKGIETAPDWCISRNRFWGTPMPVWKGTNDAGTEIVKVIGSLDELREFSVDPITKIVFKVGKKNQDFNLQKIISIQDGAELNTELDEDALVPIIMEYEKCSEEQARAKMEAYKDGKAHYYIYGKPLELHRPDVDMIQLQIEETVLTRTPEVFDCWVESGSMPFAQMHYPFENKDIFHASYPADYISEYVGQTRAWFYVLHVISNFLKDSFEKQGLKNLKGNSFKNVICTGIVFGNDGRKMSKSYGNYSDPKETINKYGAESIRISFMGSPLMTGGNVNVNDKDFENVVKTTLNPYMNVYKYFLIYANQHKWDLSKYVESENILDVWVKTRLQKFVNEFDKGFREYNLPSSVREIQPMLEDISTWFIRRSRDRFAQGSNDAISTLYTLVMEFSKVVAPLIPFTSEAIFLNMRNPKNSEESIHLEMYPESKDLTKEQTKLLEGMEKVRELATLGLELRDKAKLKLRQPLAEYVINVDLDKELLEILKDEMNVEKITFDKSAKEVSLDMEISDELRLKGNFREVARAIQDMRKKTGMKAGAHVNLKWNTDSPLKEVFEKMEDELKKTVLLKHIKHDKDLEMKLQLNGEQIGLSVETLE